MRASTSMPRRLTRARQARAARGRPMFGRRPVATRSRSNSISLPSLSANLALVTLTARDAPSRISMPSARSESATRAARRRRRGTGCGSSDLHDRHLRAGPLEELRELAADRAAAEDERAAPALRWSRSLRCSSSSRSRRDPSIGGIDGRRARGEDEPVVAKLLVVDLERRPASGRPRRRARARRSAISSHSTCELSSRSATTSRHANTLLRSSVAPLDRPERASALRRRALGARSIVFVGMHAQ